MIWLSMSILISINVNAQQNISDSTKISKQKLFETNNTKYKPTVKTMKKVGDNSTTTTVKQQPSRMVTASKERTPVRSAESLKADIEVLKSQITTAQENSFYSVEYIQKLKYALFLKTKQLNEFYPQIIE